MARKKKELPPLPEGWREGATESVNQNFLPGIQQEAHRILKRKETVTALAYMKDADPGRFSVNRIIKVLRICAYHASVKPPGYSFYRSPKVATRLMRSLTERDTSYWYTTRGTRPSRKAGRDMRHTRRREMLFSSRIG